MLMEGQLSGNREAHKRLLQKAIEDHPDSPRREFRVASLASLLASQGRAADLADEIRRYRKRPGGWIRWTLFVDAVETGRLAEADARLAELGEGFLGALEGKSLLQTYQSLLRFMHEVKKERAIPSSSALPQPLGVLRSLFERRVPEALRAARAMEAGPRPDGRDLTLNWSGRAPPEAGCAGGSSGARIHRASGGWDPFFLAGRATGWTPRRRLPAFRGNPENRRTLRRRRAARFRAAPRLRDVPRGSPSPDARRGEDPVEPAPAPLRPQACGDPGVDRTAHRAQ